MSTRTRRKRRAARTVPRPSRVRVALVVLLTLATLMIATGGFAAAAAYSYFTTDLPSPDKLQDRQVFRSTKILDRNGRLLYELFDPQGGRRTSVKLAEISPRLIEATIATEDASFYENPGVNVRGFLRAVVANLRGEEIQGGSSITQQLIKGVLLSPEVSVDRKVREMILAYQVNQQYTKDQILEWYLNEIPFGNTAYGIEAAAESYFGKSAKELDLAESAMLAGLPQAPSLWSPLVDAAASKRRQRMVLDSMVREGYITEQESDVAYRQPLEYQPMKYGIEAPHFVMYVRTLLERKYGPTTLYSRGLTVRTTIDLDMQHMAERFARQQVEKLKASNIHNAALVALRPNTGEILTMLGSVDYFNREISGQVNIATTDRQPGSTFKPITYAGAFLKGWGPGTVVLDDYTIFKDRNNRPYTPRNVDKKWHGPVTVRSALATSMNIPAVKTIEFAGVKDTVALAHQMGITSLEPDVPYDLSLTLGTGEVQLLDLTYAFSVFANGGVMHGQPVPSDSLRPGYRTVEPVAILSVEDTDGNILEEFTGPQRVEALPPQVAYLVTDILSDNAARTPLMGPNSPLKLDRPAAAKTGTTENNRDLWTVGYTPDLVTGVWVGNSDNREIAQVLSSLTAAPIWHDFMAAALADTTPKEFDQPGGLEKVQICSISGTLPGRYCPTETRVTELFIKGTAPVTECNIHRLVVVDRTTGYLATAATSAENAEQKVIEVYPPEWAAWAKAAGKPQPPTRPPDPGPAQAGPAGSRDENSALLVDSPTTGAAVRDVVEIRGTASGKGFASYRVEYGEGVNPTSWSQIGGEHVTQVENGVLERWDARSLGGLYKLRITLTERPPTPPTPTPGPAPTSAPPRSRLVEVPVIVDNTPPAVSITFPENGSSLDSHQMERLTITAQVSDNHRVAKTDFYVDDKLVGTSTAAPASVEWTTTPGLHILRAVARDAPGNETRSQDVSVVLR